MGVLPGRGSVTPAACSLNAPRRRRLQPKLECSGEAPERPRSIWCGPVCPTALGGFGPSPPSPEPFAGSPHLGGHARAEGGRGSSRRQPSRPTLNQSIPSPIIVWSNMARVIPLGLEAMTSLPAHHRSQRRPSPRGLDRGGVGGVEPDGRRWRSRSPARPPRRRPGRDRPGRRPAPSRAMTSAVGRPIPRAAPVITVTLPATSAFDVTLPTLRSRAPPPACILGGTASAERSVAGPGYDQHRPGRRGRGRTRRSPEPRVPSPTPATCDRGGA